MTGDHIETDAIVELGNASEWQLETLAHLDGCESCRTEFLELAVVRQAVPSGDALSSEVVERIVQVALDEQPAVNPTSQSYDWVAKVLTPMLAAAAAVLVVLMSA